MMRARASQIACFLVLLSAFGAADAVARAAKGSCPDCASVRVLLLQIAGTSPGKPTQPSLAAAVASGRSGASTEAQASLPWTMRPPAAQSVARSEASGSGL